MRVFLLNLQNEIDEKMRTEWKIQNRFRQIALEEKAFWIKSIRGLVHMTMFNVNAIEKIDDVFVSNIGAKRLI